ncbi:MAG: GNAT family N-acetyltransferase [Chloroflexi bacterium]|nr:GNAT family N-acetyltransferase [Chloroflexota bacterium]
MIAIRRATVDDAQEIAAVHITAWQETYPGIVPDEFLKNLSMERRTERWTASLSDPADLYHRAIVAEMDGQVVGFSNYGPPQEKDSGFDGELYAIYILKSVQGCGIGRMLMTEAAKGLLELGLNSMLVWVLRENVHERGFYERMGGAYVHEKSIVIGGKELVEVAYGWRDLSRWRVG